MRLQRLKRAGAALLLAGLANGFQPPAHGGAVTESDANRAAVLRALQAADSRVAAIAYRLMSANSDLCRDKTGLTGLVLHDLHQYGGDYQGAAIELFGLDRGPGVSVVVPDSPAAQAGVRPGDIVLAINGQAPPSGGDDSRAKLDYTAMDALLGQLETAAAAGPLTLDLARGGERVTPRIKPRPGCASRVQLEPSDRKDAGATGRVVTVTTALADYTASDDELAFVIAHELAHNILGHRKHLDEAGIGTGLASHFGKGAARIRATEREADHLGLFLVARAGYDVNAALAFWRRFGRLSDLGIFSDPTHPRRRDRERDIQATIGRILLLKSQGEPLLP